MKRKYDDNGEMLSQHNKKRKTEEIEQTHLDSLPPEILTKTLKILPSKSVVAFSSTSKKHFTLFKPLTDDLKEVHELLHFVTRGDHEAVKRLLNEDLSLIYRKGDITDCSGRTFNNISGFEYALWALDKHMWTTMLDCVPRDQDGRKVLIYLLRQYDKVGSAGVSYTFLKEEKTERHFDFRGTILEKLHQFLHSIYNIAPQDKNWELINKQLIEGVGGAQKLLPMHIVYEFCSEEHFYPLPAFDSQPLASKQFKNGDSYEDWYSANSELGTKFAICKGRTSYASAEEPETCEWPAVEHTFEAMKKLCQLRISDRINLDVQLEKQIDDLAQHQIRPN